MKLVTWMPQSVIFAGTYLEMMAGVKQDWIVQSSWKRKGTQEAII